MAAAKRPAKRVAKAPAKAPAKSAAQRDRDNLLKLAKSVESGLRKQKLTPGSAEWNKAFKDTAAKLTQVAKVITDQPTLRAEKKPAKPAQTPAKKARPYNPLTGPSAPLGRRLPPPPVS